MATTDFRFIDNVPQNPRAASLDAVLLDWHMPVKTGIEFLKELRTMVDGEKPIVLFCTNQTDLEHIHEALDAGANEYIMKPFDSEIIALKFSQVGLV